MIKADPFYFSRSDLSDEEKLAMLKARLERAEDDIAAGRVYTLEEAREKLKTSLSKHMKQAS